MMNQTQHLSTSDYDRLLLHALSGEEQVKIEQHLVACERCRTDHAGYAADARQFSQEIFPRTVQRFRSVTPGSFWGRLLRRRVMWIIAPAMTVVLALVVARGRLSNDVHRDSRASAGDDIRIKGGEPTLRSFARRMQHVFAIQDGMELHPGDEMRFVVDSPRLQFLLLASVDGAGRVNIYFPYDGSQSGVIATGKPTELPGSIVLDTAPGPERVFALYSKNPLLRAELDPVLKALGASGPAAIRAKTLLPIKAENQFTFLFEKAAP
jgi:hypothetical protein